MPVRDISPSQAPQKVWRLVRFYLRDQPELLPLVELYSVGITDSRRIGNLLDHESDIVCALKEQLHARLGEMRRSVEAGRQLATRMRSPLLEGRSRGLRA